MFIYKNTGQFLYLQTSQLPGQARAIGSKLVQAIDLSSVFAIFQTLSHWFHLATFFSANFPRVLLSATASKSKEGKENLSSFAHFLYVESRIWVFRVVIELGQQKNVKKKKCDMRACNFLLINPTAFLSLSLYLFEAIRVQIFYLQKRVYLLKIATEGF